MAFGGLKPGIAAPSRCSDSIIMRRGFNAMRTYDIGSGRLFIAWSFYGQCRGLLGGTLGRTAGQTMAFLVSRPANLGYYLSALPENARPMIHYPVPPHRQKVHANTFVKKSCSAAERLSATSISLPLTPHMPAGEVAVVTEACRNFAAL
jgi:hypothetical protein